MIEHHAEHEVVRLRCLELLVAEGARELMRQRRVLVHHDGQARLTGRRRLNDHVKALADRQSPQLALPGSALQCYLSGGVYASAIDG